MNKSSVLFVFTILFCMGLFVSCGDTGDGNGLGTDNDALPSDADNGVEIHINGDLTADTIWAGPMTFDIYIKNSVDLGGMTLGFQIYSSDGATWLWGPDTAYVVANSRMDPDGDGESVWDFTGFYIRAENLDNITPDTILVGGISLNETLSAGELERMIALQLSVGPADETIRSICIDRAVLPSGGDFVFVDAVGLSFGPLWPGPFCWPVKTQ